MNTFSSWLGQLLRYFRSLVAIGLLCLVLGSPLPAQATSVSPQLKEQVLQIIREHPEVVLESIQAYQLKQQQKLQQARQAFLQDLKNDPQGLISNSPTTGASDSKTILIEFSDFQCPYCAEAHKTLKQLMKKHHNDVKLVYKNFPLNSLHAEAIPAAKAAWAAHQQGKFWEYHDALFTHQDQLGEDLYLDVAKKLNLDLEKFEKDREIANTEIQQDIQLAEKLGLSGTPFFIMKSETVSGAVQLTDLEKLLARAK
ncbi:DsbA family protein [Fischerella sp. PCC 9605]|uniref:DsbA family protein n=1 Tax=Fischerella sp. PCC 9605 TaxID=1173024 RepID=UPI000479E339|nr:thioredoxin domain-containing protein [Fischerella sp. PCC 9605]